MRRCDWCLRDDLYIRYHDEEWGVPVHDDLRHFEFLVLESAQAGLSWLTVLRKRENYRLAYDGFNPDIVAQYDQKKIEELLSNPGIIRNRKKIEASVLNARMYLPLREEFGSFDHYLWRFVEGNPVINSWKSIDEIPPKTGLSDRISDDLKKRGFRFIGSTIIYSHLQAVGVVNDHITGCYRYKETAAGNPRGEGL